MTTTADMIVSSRRKETWPRDEYRLIDRASRTLKAHNVKLAISCKNPVCPEPNITVHNPGIDRGGFILRCGCTERVLTRFY